MLLILVVTQDPLSIRIFVRPSGITRAPKLLTQLKPCDLMKYTSTL